MTSSHHQAVLALFGSLPLYDGQVTGTPAYPYRIVRVSPGLDDRAKLCGRTDVLDCRFWITSVGLSRTAVDILSDQAWSALVDQRPVVEGWKNTRVLRETSIPIQPDNDVTDTKTGLHPLFTVETYFYRSFRD